MTLTRLPGGANNRVYRVSGTQPPALLKAYFRGPGDSRDRLGAEFGFLRFASDRGITGIPRAFACDPAAGVGLYEFVGGRLVRAQDVGEPEVRRAAAFVEDVNRGRHEPAARRLPTASEACFALREHLECVERRVDRLTGVSGATPLERRAKELVEDALVPTWRSVRATAEARSASLGVSLDALLPSERRCISPSDFGFHNALVSAGGELTFLDFEYAGWDDPAKLICDFFCQVAVPVGGEHLPAFAQRVIAAVGGDESDLARAELLLPVYRVKWCCIQLNDFTAAGRERRRFALGEADDSERQSNQLDDAALALRSLSMALAD